jgi:hypothetical protein
MQRLARDWADGETGDRGKGKGKARGRGGKGRGAGGGPHGLQT